MTTQTITGYDLFNDVSAGSSSPNINNLLDTYINFDPSISSVISNYADESWVAKKTGSDSYDDSLTKLQTIALKSKEGSVVTFVAQSKNDQLYFKGSFDFSNSSGSVKVKASKYDNSDYFDSITGGSGNDYIRSVSYINLGDVGKSDDINEVLNYSNHVSHFTDKNGESITKYTESLALNYIGKGYNVNILTKTLGVDYSESTTISKYIFSNADTGFSITLTGTAKKNYVENSDSYVQSEMLSKVTLITTDYKLTGANISYNAGTDQNGDIVGLTNSGYYSVAIINMQDDLMANVVPNLMNGNNNITIINKEGIQIDAGIGNDSIVGGVGDDTITGGAGSDKLTGGKGADMFSFSNIDFYTKNANGELVFNKSSDTITDFNLKEHDLLDFTDLGQLGFYASLAAAKDDGANLFYVKGSGNIYLNTSTTDGFTATVIVTLTGKPALNADGTDFNYPSD